MAVAPRPRHLVGMDAHAVPDLDLTRIIIGAAIEVHKDKGPGLMESIYEWCLLCELRLQGLLAETQRVVRIQYKEFEREDSLRFDLLVENRVLVEVKSVERILPIHQAQLLSYMKLLNVPAGLLINFNVSRLTEGVFRLRLPTGAEPKILHRSRSEGDPRC